MDLSTMTTTEIKALGFEQMALLTQCQNNLRVIEQELINRAKAQEAEPPCPPTQ